MLVVQEPMSLLLSKMSLLLSKNVTITVQNVTITVHFPNLFRDLASHFFCHYVKKGLF